MADIELVIKIPEEIYKDIMIHNRELRESGKSAYYFEGLIQNGILLPKGHGRLIDADVLEKAWHEEFLKGMKMSAGMVNIFNDAQTIIEADKAESEVNNG